MKIDSAAEHTCKEVSDPHQSPCKRKEKLLCDEERPKASSCTHLTIGKHHAGHLKKTSGIAPPYSQEGRYPKAHLVLPHLFPPDSGETTSPTRPYMSLSPSHHHSCYSAAQRYTRFSLLSQPPGLEEEMSALSMVMLGTRNE